MSLVLMVSLLHVSTALITKHSLLTPRTPVNDSFISLNKHSVSTVAETYFLITVNSQHSYDLKLSLDNSYGFDSLYTSTFSVTIDGFDSLYNKNTDMLFVFSVGNIQYMSFLLHLDKHNHFNKIYFPSNYTQNVTEWISNNNTINNRYNKISNNNEWIPLNQHQSLWPLQFKITNNPNKGYSIFEFYHNISSTLSVKYEMETLLFEPNKEIDIYISGNTINEQFYISSFDILLTKNTSTHTPTNAPTPYPIISPTPEPTYKPTFTPVFIYKINNTNPITNLSQTDWLPFPSENEYFINNNKIKLQAIIVIGIILISVGIFCVIVLVYRKCSAPVFRKHTYEMDDENENNTDSESNKSNNEYMNEGVLSPTGSMGVSGVKFNGFIVGSRTDATIIDGIRKFSMNTIISNVTSRKSTTEISNKKSIDSRSISMDENISDTKTVNSDTKTDNIIPLHEKQNMEKFIKMIEDKRNKLMNENSQNDDGPPGHEQQIISRKVSDEINYCVSFNYCDEMIE